MDPTAFATLVRAIATAVTRRRLLGRLVALLPAAGIGMMREEGTEARGRSHGRNRGHHPGKGKDQREGHKQDKPHQALGRCQPPRVKCYTDGGHCCSLALAITQCKNMERSLVCPSCPPYPEPTSQCQVLCGGFYLLVDRCCEQHAGEGTDPVRQCHGGPGAPAGTCPPTCRANGAQCLGGAGSCCSGRCDLSGTGNCIP
jgi:hypothetical protein